MIEIDPEADYTLTQVAAMLNIPESRAQGLWQQSPVCGYDVIGYCRRQGIPHTVRSRPAESKFARAMRNARAKSDNRTEQELFAMRDHYRRMTPEERDQFANLIRALATATEEFSVSCIYVRVNYLFDQNDEEGNCVYSESAEASPKAIRERLPVWDETGDVQQ